MRLVQPVIRGESIRLVENFLIILLVCLGVSCEGPQGPGYDGLTDSSVKPRVIYTYPEANTQGPYENFGTTILVRFNKVMDRTTLRRALRFTSPDNDVRADTAFISTSTGDVFTIYIKQMNPDLPFRWNIDQTYTLSIDTTAEDVNGNKLVPMYLMSFIPEPFFRVTSIFPTDNAIDINPQSSISLRFNSSIDTSIFSAIQLTPPVPGYWRLPGRYKQYIDSTYISFMYSSNTRLTTNTDYTISIPDTVHDKYGHALQQGFLSSFTTTKFGVLYTYPSDGSISVSPSNHQIRIQFSDEVDASTISNGITFSPNLSGSFSIATDERVVYFLSSSDFPTNTTITVTVDTSVRSSSGSTLLEPYRFSFMTDVFKIIWTYPADKDTNASVDGPVFISVNSAYNASTVQGTFSISPNVAGLFNTSYQSEFRFSPIVQLEPSTWYTVAVSTGLESLNGDHLAEPYMFRFRTVPFKVLYSNPQDGTTGFPRNNLLFFTFSLNLDTGSVRNAFHITPGVPGVFSYYLEPARYFTFSPAGGFAASTIYTVTLDTTLMSKSGHRLSVPYQITFASGE